MPIFGMLDLGLIILKALGVVGGGAIGWLGGGWATNRAAKLATKQPPNAVKRGGQASGAIGLAYLVMLWVFGNGGGGWGFGGGPGSGPGTAETGTGHGEESSTVSIKEKPPVEPPPKPAASRTTSARVELLGGARVRDLHYYVLEGDNTPKTLEGLKEALSPQMRPGSDPLLKQLVIVVYQDSVDVRHAAVTELQRWAKQQGLDVVLSTPAGSRP